MTAPNSTGSMPLTDEPFTAEERLALRQVLRAADRRKWISRQLKVTVPVGVAIGTTLWGAVEWLKAHVTLRP